MAFGEVVFFSKELNRDVEFRFILPGERPEDWERNPKAYTRPTKALYLLHGHTKNNLEWMMASIVPLLAVKYNMAIIMPSGENSFYLNGPDGMFTSRKYNDYVGKELVEYATKMLGLTGKREDTFIAGESMGGFGAVMVGLNHPETFSKIGAFSPAMIQDRVDGSQLAEETRTINGSYLDAAFGVVSDISTSDRNPEVRIKKMKAEGISIPELYMCCGEEDGLLENDRRFKKFLEEQGIALTYREGHGEHNFYYWNEILPEAMEWMLGDASY